MIRFASYTDSELVDSPAIQRPGRHLKIINRMVGYEGSIPYIIDRNKKVKG